MLWPSMSRYLFISWLTNVSCLPLQSSVSAAFIAHVFVERPVEQPANPIKHKLNTKIKMKDRCFALSGG